MKKLSEAGTGSVSLSARTEDVSMKRLPAVLGILATVLILSTVQSAAEKSEKEKPALRGEYAIMAAECRLSEEQAARLAEAVEARKAALDAWQKAHGEALAACEKKVAEARQAKDKEALAKAREEAKAASAGRHAVSDEHKARILAILDPDQRRAWEGFCLYRGVMRKIKRVEPTEAQITSVKAACAAAAREMLALEGAAKEAAQDASEIREQLDARIKEEILTAAQREALSAPREKRPKPEKPAKDPAAPDAPETANPPAL